ncbi:MAG: hypothetical protein K9N46_00050 [Candidatus Marinimicrobia bacterium]|nr:hypothetical protein [Candidatus Neomarinimicrobiota bacterium]MCF7829927.1 hypothetical protein [Candidatus Neomarinimicrobiota bacterium]MCF7879110.1 hypothetical protein [Candidatus Neomarinimicrobiota bacterium]
MKRFTLLLIFTLAFAHSVLGANKAAFIHGFGGDETSWGQSGTITYLLNEDIIDGFINIEYDSKNQSPDSIAASVVSEVYTANSPGDKWIIVGHSLGGLIARGVESGLKGSGIQVAGILTLSTPHQGAPAADYIFNDARSVVSQFTADAKAGPNYGPHSKVDFALYLADFANLWGGDDLYGQVYKIPGYLDDAKDKAEYWIKLDSAANADTKLVPGGELIENLNSQLTNTAHRSIIGAEKSPTIMRWMSELRYFGSDESESNMMEYYEGIKDWYSANTHAYKNDMVLAQTKMSLYLSAIIFNPIQNYKLYKKAQAQYTYFKKRYNAWNRGYATWANIDNTWAQAIGAGNDYTYTYKVWHVYGCDLPIYGGIAPDMETLFYLPPCPGGGYYNPDGYYKTVTVHVPVARKNDGLVSPNLAVWKKGQNQNDRSTNFYYGDEGADGGYNHSEIRRAQRAYTLPGVFSKGQETPQWTETSDWMRQRYE